MSRRDVETVATLAAHLATTHKSSGKYAPKSAAECASDALALQKLGARARRNAAKRWIEPDARQAPGDITPYMHECARVSREVERVLAPYGLYPRDFTVGRMGVVFLTLPGEYTSLFGKGFLI